MVIFNLSYIHLCYVFRMILTQKEYKRDWGTTTESIANVPISKQAIARCSTKAHHGMVCFR
jgi:hypothetical protein